VYKGSMALWTHLALNGHSDLRAAVCFSLHEDEDEEHRDTEVEAEAHSLEDSFSETALQLWDTEPEEAQEEEGTDATEVGSTIHCLSGCQPRWSAQRKLASLKARLSNRNTVERASTPKCIQTRLFLPFKLSSE